LNFTLLVPAAGDGSRLGLKTPKALIEVGGLPLFIQAVLPFFEIEDCREVVISAPAESVNRFQSLLNWYLAGRRVRIVAGGCTRQESVGRALESADESNDLVLVHDAARPFATGELIRRVAEGVSSEFAACAPALALTDTIKRASGDPLVVQDTVERQSLYAVQTPQALRRDALQEAYRRLACGPFAGTDDVSLIEHFALGAVRLVEGDPGNVKITSAADLEFARERLAWPRS